MTAMHRSLLPRGLALLTSTVGLIVGCSAGSAPEGDLPPTRVGTPEEMQNLQKELLQKKVSSGAQYKAPPAVKIPRQ